MHEVSIVEDVKILAISEFQTWMLVVIFDPPAWVLLLPFCFIISLIPINDIFPGSFVIATTGGDWTLGRERFDAMGQVLECVLSLDDISGDIAHIDNVEVDFG